MNIQDINGPSAYGNYGDTTAPPVPLSQQVQAAAQATNDPVLPAEIDHEKYVSPLHEWLLASEIELQTANPALVSNLIKKIRDLRGDDGQQIYKSYNDMAALVTLLHSKFTDEGAHVDPFFEKTSGLLFGMAVFMQSLTNDIFFPADDEQDKDLF